jgi:hypothetical protein
VGLEAEANRGHVSVRIFTLPIINPPALKILSSINQETEKKTISRLTKQKE